MVRWMQRFFQYLDRFYVDMSSILNLTDQGFAQFKINVFERLLDKVTQAVLEQVEKDRKGEPVDSDLLNKVIQIYTYLSNDIVTGNSINCLAELETKLITSSRNFFQQQSNKMMNLSLVEYLTIVDNMLTKEEDRILQYLKWQDMGNKVIYEF